MNRRPTRYDTVWRDGFWKKMRGLGIRGKRWRMMKTMTECARSAVMLNGEISKYVDILQGVAQGCMYTIAQSIQGTY